MAAKVCAKGARCTLLGVVGAGAAAAKVELLLAGHGVDRRLVVDAGQATTQKTRLTACTAALPGTGLVILSDYAKGCLPDPAAFIAAASAAGLRCLVAS